MKRNNVVVNAKALKAGRGIAAWAASGMNWAHGPLRDRVEAAGGQALRDPARLQQIGREALALRDGEAVTQTAAAQLVLGEPL